MKAHVKIEALADGSTNKTERNVILKKRTKWRVVVDVTLLVPNRLDLDAWKWTLDDELRFQLDPDSKCERTVRKVKMMAGRFHDLRNSVLKEALELKDYLLKHDVDCEDVSVVIEFFEI